MGVSVVRRGRIRGVESPAGGNMGRMGWIDFVGCVRECIIKLHCEWRWVCVRGDWLAASRVYYSTILWFLGVWVVDHPHDDCII